MAVIAGLEALTKSTFRGGRNLFRFTVHVVKAIKRTLAR